VRHIHATAQLVNIQGTRFTLHLADITERLKNERVARRSQRL